MKRGLIAFLLVWGAMVNFSATSVAQTAETPDTSLINATVIAEIRAWLKNPVVSMSIAAQNRKHEGLSNDAIVTLDKQWRAERDQDDQPLIAGTLSNPLSNYLTQIQAASGGLLTEIFIMDAQGLNVGQSAITSDYWQGDEAKFQKTFPVGPTASFIDEAEFLDETKTWQAQINLTIADSNNAAIGAITVQYNLTELARRLGSF